MVFNEREAIRLRMEKIAEEKKILYRRNEELDKEYNFYIERLRELDGNGGGGPSGEQAPPNAPETTAASPHSKAKKVYRGNLHQYDFDALKKGLNHFKNRQAKKQQGTETIDSPGEPSNDLRTRGKQYNLKEVAAVVEEILKENGKPMEIRKLRSMLADRGYRWKHFLPTLPNIMRYSDHIKKPYRGFITYTDSTDVNVDDEEIQVSSKVAGGFVMSGEVLSAEGEAAETDIKAAADEIPDTAVTGKKIGTKQ